jgi:hypothetical protein
MAKTIPALRRALEEGENNGFAEYSLKGIIEDLVKEAEGEGSISGSPRRQFNINFNA